MIAKHVLEGLREGNLMRRRLSDEQKVEVKRVLREALERIESVRFAYLFGSFLLKGSFEDVDVAVYLQPEALEGREPLNVGECVF